jgi:Tol biopolymer transport system component
VEQVELLLRRNQMNKVLKIVTTIAALALLVALAVALAGVFPRLGSDGPGGEAPALGYPGPEDSLPSQAAPSPDTPTLEPTLPPGVVAIPTAVGGGIPGYIVGPTPPAFPTLPPPLVPTLRAGPSITPLASPPPADDAAGVIILAAREDSAVSLHSLPINAAGLPDGHAASIPGAADLFTGAGYSEGQVHYSPDGKRLAVVANTEGGDIVNVFDIDTGLLGPLFRPERGGGLGSFVGWHPDSRHVLYQAETNLGANNRIGLWLVNTATGESVTLVGRYPADPAGMWGDIQGAAISSDGQRLAFSLKKDIFSECELWMVNIDGSKLQQIAVQPLSNIYKLSWAPDGNRIAFMGNGLMVMDADGSNLRTVAQNGIAAGYPYSAAWSPDSRWLVYVTAPDPETFATDWDARVFGGSNIVLVDVIAGTERVLLSDGSTGNLDPAWSPNGSHIAFVSDREGASEVWTARTDGSMLQQLTSLGRFVRFPFWQRP